MKHQTIPDAVDVDARRLLVMEAYVNGTTMHAIARQMGVSVATVSRDVAAVRDDWREQMTELYDTWKDRELDRLDKLEVMASEGWERSRRDGKKVVNSEKGKTKERQQRDGDPAFLKVLATCIGERCRILGLHAPKKLDHTTGGVPIKYVQDVDPDKV